MTKPNLSRIQLLALTASTAGILALTGWWLRSPKSVCTPDPSISGSTYVLPAGPKVLAYYGDSTVWGAKANADQVAHPPPTFVHLTGYTVLNLGLKGDSTQDAVEGIAPINRAPWVSLMQQTASNVVVVNFGINDRNRNVPITTYKANLETIVDAGRKTRKLVILETPNPVEASSSRIPILPYVEAMREVAASRGLLVIDQYAYLTKVIQNAPIRDYMPDGIHPNQTTYQLKGEYANAQLNKWLCQ